MTKFLFLTLSLLIFTLGSASAQESNFYNVLLQDGADPSVFRHTDGYYYSTVTTGGDVRLRRHRTLSAMGGGESLSIWQGCCHIWAPEISFIDGAWYVYFAKSADTSFNHRMFVLSNPSPDPFEGKWTLQSLEVPGSDHWAIDGIALKSKGKYYFLWSGHPGDGTTNQNLYIAPMDSPTKIGGARVKISEPEYPWETNTQPMVNEGPEVVVRGGKINLVYSASGSWTDTYSLALITANEGDDLLDPLSWQKKDRLIFQSANGIYGPGHHGFTTSPDGKEDWIVYHSARWQGSGWTRLVRAQKFGWNEDNTLELGSPLPPNLLSPLPSGEPMRYRYEAEEALVKGNAKVLLSESASRIGKVGHLDSENDRLTFKMRVEKEGIYNLSLRTSNGTPGYSALKMMINKMSFEEIEVANTGWDNWSNHLSRVHLKAGENEISYGHLRGLVEIDCIDVFSDN